MTNKKIQGDLIEAKALEHYLARGYELLAKNFRLKCGELDLVLRDPSNVLVVVEVRSRTAQRSWETPEQSLSAKKLERIRKTTELFLRQYRGRFSGLRFDLAAWSGSQLEIYPNFWWY